MAGIHSILAAIASGKPVPAWVRVTPNQATTSGYTGAVVASGGQVVLVGSAGLAATAPSVTSTSWSLITGLGTTNFNGVIRAGGTGSTAQLLAYGSDAGSAKIYTALANTGYTSWTDQTNPIGFETITAVQVITSTSPPFPVTTYLFATSSGKVWYGSNISTLASVNNFAQFSSIAYSPTLNLLVASVSGLSGTVYTSTNGGASWSFSSLGPSFSSLTLSQVIWDGANFIASGSGGVFIYSSNGTTWTQSTVTGGLPSAYPFLGSWSIGNPASPTTSAMAMATGWTSLYSADRGVNWNSMPIVLPPPSPAPTAFYGVPEGIYLSATGSGTAYVNQGAATNTRWSVVQSDATLNAITEYGTTYVAGFSGTAAGNGIYTRSSTGTLWEISGQTPQTNGLAASGSVVVAATESGPYYNAAPTSSTWSSGSVTSSVGSIPSFAFKTAFWDGTRFLIGGSSGSTAYATDGISFTGVNTTQHSSTAYSSTLGLWVRVGGFGTVATSSDNGVTWTSRTSGTSAGLSKVVWANNVFIAVGSSGAIITSTDGIAWTSRTSNTTNTLNSVDWDGARWVAVGSLGAYTYSADLATWVSVPQNDGYNAVGLHTSGSWFIAGSGSNVWTNSGDGVIWTRATISVANIIFYGATGGNATTGSVVVGSGGNIFRTTNGTTFTQVSSTGTTTFRAVTYTLAQTTLRFIAVGDGGTIRYSNTNGLTWTLAGGLASTQLLGVAASSASNLCVAVGASGHVRSSSDGGVNWTTRTSVTANTLNAVVYGGNANIFVAVGNSGTICTTQEGATWTVRTSGTTANLRGVTYDGVKFIVVGDGVSLTSTNGTSWTLTTGNPVSMNAITASTSSFAVSVGNNRAVYTTTNGTAYTARWEGTSNTFFDCVNSSGTAGATALTLVGDNGTIRVRASGSSPVQLVARTSGTFNALSGVTATSSQIVTVGANGTVLTSPNSTTWTAQTSGTANYLTKVANSGSVFAACGSNGTIVRSTDGVTWTTSSFLSPVQLNGIAFGNSTFLVTGNTNTIGSSANASTWTFLSGGTVYTIYGFAKSPSIYVAVGDSGSLSTSTDGINWLYRGTIAGVVLESVTWVSSLSLFVAVGDAGTILTSPDGTTWTSRTSGTSENLNSVSVYGTYIFAAGNAGTLLYSEDAATWAPATIPTTSDLRVVFGAATRALAGGVGYGVFTFQ